MQNESQGDLHLLRIWRVWLEGKKEEKPATHLVITTKDQHWTKIESHGGNDLASQPRKKIFFNIEKPFKEEKIFVCKRKYFR